VVVDSLSLSWGQGLQAILAAQMARQGATMDKIVEALNGLRQRIHIFVQLDTIEQLRHGGRAANLIPYLERVIRALDIKPLANFVDGEFKLLGITRSYKKGIERIKQEILRLGPLENLAVIHTRREAVAQQLADELARLTHIAREHIWVEETGAVISCHAGEGVIAAVGVQAL
jgi:DegV family protein with EDD domain